MRRILSEFYTWMYRLSGVKLFSYIAGLVYLSLVNCVIVKGVAMLLQGWIGFVGILIRLFSFPFILVTFFVMLGLTFWIVPDIQSIAKEAKKNNSFTTVLLYTAFGLLLFLYMQFGDTFLV